MNNAKWDERNGEEGNLVLPEVTDQVMKQSTTPAKLKWGRENCTLSLSKL